MVLLFGHMDTSKLPIRAVTPTEEFPPMCIRITALLLSNGEMLMPKGPKNNV